MLLAYMTERSTALLVITFYPLIEVFLTVDRLIVARV